MKKYPLSYTFAWAADAWDLLYWKYQLKNPGVTSEGLWSDGYFLALNPFFIPCSCLRVQTLVSSFGTTVP